MEIKFLSRKDNPKEQSIEKLFYYLKNQFFARSFRIQEVKNPYGPGILNMFRSMLYFRKHTGNELIHVTGQIHFGILLLKSRKIVITVHDLGLYRPLGRFRKCFFLLFWVYLPFWKAHRIIAISQKTKEEIVEIMPSVANKIIVIPNCLTSEVEADIFEKSNSIPSILIVGTRSNKNIERSIRACAGLAIRLKIVGELSSEQSNLLAEMNILYDNYVSISECELTDVYRESDILLFPSLYEGFGLPILEAQAQNVLVITSNFEPMQSTSGRGALFVDPKDENMIRDAILQAINMTTEEKINLLQIGKDNVNAFNPSKIAECYIKVYKDLGK